MQLHLGCCTPALHTDIFQCVAIQAEPTATADPADILHRAMAADAATIAAERGSPSAPGLPVAATGLQIGAAGPVAAASPVGDINAAVIRAQMRLETQAAAEGSKVVCVQRVLLMSFIVLGQVDVCSAGTHFKAQACDRQLSGVN